MTRRSEYWDKVDKYKQKLRYEVIQQAAANDWQSESRGKIIAELDEIIKTRHYRMIRLGKEDGR